MDFSNQLLSDFDYIADPVDTSFLKDYTGSNITDLLVSDVSAADKSTAALYDFNDYVNAKPSYQAANQPTYFDAKRERLDRYSQSSYFGLQGFSPELGRENEYRYGRMQTWGDMLGNAVSGAYKLGASTFVEGWKGWANMASALVNLDPSKLVGTSEELYQAHQDQEAIMDKYAIFATPESEQNLFSKQLLGDMIQQSGYSLGTMAQFLSEELLTAGLASQFSLGKLGLTSSARMAKGAYKTGELINDAKKLGDIWKYDSVVDKVLSGAKKYVSLVGTVDDVVKLHKEGASVLQLAAVGAGGVKRSLSELNMAMTEARMEAAGTYGELYNRMVDEHTQKTGSQPLGEDLIRIREHAQKAAQANFATNTGIIAAMNRLQFDNLFSKFGTDRKILKAFGEMADDVVKVTGKAGEKQATRLVKSGLSGLKDISATFGRNKAAWEGAKQFGKGMFKWEFTEGIQELIQEGSNQALQDYYYDLYSGNDASLSKSFGKGVAGQANQDGLKTFLMGALTGRLISPINKVTNLAMDRFNTTEQQRAERKAQLEDAISTVNAFFTNPKTALNETIANFKVQNKAAENMEEALKNADEYWYNNAKDSALAKLVSSAKKTDMLESVLDTMREYGNHLTVEEMKEAFPSIEPSDENIKNAQAYFGKIANEVEEFAKNWEELNERFGEMIRPEIYAEGSEARRQALIAERAVQDAIEVLATSKHKGNRAIERAMKIYGEVQKNTVIGASSASAFRVLGGDDLMLQEIDLIKAELKGLNLVENKDAATLKQIENKERELDALQRWKENWIADPANVGKMAMLNTPGLKKAYADYVSAKNATSNISQPVVNTDMETSWTSFMDYVSLTKDSQEFIDAYNTLANPVAFSNMVNKSKEAIQAVMRRLAEEAKSKIEEAADEKANASITITDEKGNDITIDIQEGKRYLTESDPKRRVNEEGDVKRTYNRDVLFIESIANGMVTVKVNGAEAPQTFTFQEFGERFGRLYDMSKMDAPSRMYYMNRDKEFTLNVRAKNGKPHKVGGKHSKQNYAAAGVEVAARLELAKEDGKTKLKITYTNPVSGEKEVMPYIPLYLNKYRTGVIDLTTLPELDAALEVDAEQSRKENLQLQMEAIDELIQEQEQLMENTKAATNLTQTEIESLKREVEDLIFVAEELEKLGKDQIKERNALKKLVNAKKISDIQARIPELKQKIQELEEKRAQLEAEMTLMEDLYMAYLEAQEELTNTQEPFENNGKENIWQESSEKLTKLEAEKLSPEIQDDEFAPRIEAIQAEKNILDEQISYLTEMVNYLESLLTGYSKFPDIMAILSDPKNLLSRTAPEALPSEKGKISPEIAATLFDVEAIRADLVRLKLKENRQDFPKQEKLAAIDTILNGLSFDNRRVLDEDKRNAIDIMSFAQKLRSSKSRLDSLVAKSNELQASLEEYTAAAGQRAEMAELSRRLMFLKPIAESLSKRTERKISDKKAKKLVDKARQKESTLSKGGIILELDNQAPTKKTNFYKVGFKKTWGRHYVDKGDTQINTENGNDRFFRFSSDVAVKGQGFVFQVVTSANEEALGLTGIRDVAYNENDIKLVVMKAIKNEDGTVDYKYVNQKGEILSDEEAKDVNNLVYSSMADMSKWDVDRVRKDGKDGDIFAVDQRITDEQIQQRINEHTDYQAKLQERTKKEDVYLNIVGSTSGKQRVQTLADGSLDRTDMENRIVEANPDYTAMRSVTNPDNFIELRVSTDKDGVDGILPGRVIMQEYFFDARGNKVRTDKVYRVFNRELSEDEKENLYNVMIRYQQLFERVSTKIEELKLNEAETAEFGMILNYLRGIIAWGAPEKGTEAVSDRFFWIDNGLHRGDQVIDFTETGLRVNKEDLFKGIFHHVNHYELSKNKPYTTVKIVDGKAVPDKNYDTYTEYLMAKREDGSVAPVYTTLPTVDSEYPQRTNVNLLWADPADEVEKTINLPENKQKKGTYSGPSSKEIDAMIDEFIDGKRKYVYVLGIAFSVEKVKGGYMFTATKKKKDGTSVTKEMFDDPFPSYDIFKQEKYRAVVKQGITKYSNYQYGKKSVLDSLSGVKLRDDEADAKKAARVPVLKTDGDTETVNKQSLLQVANKVASGEKMNSRETLLYGTNKEVIDAMIAEANKVVAQQGKPAAVGKVTRQPVITSVTTDVPLDVDSAVENAKREGNMLIGTRYAINPQGKPEILYSVQVEIYNDNIEIAKANLRNKLEDEYDPEFSDDFRVAFKDPEETEDFDAFKEWMGKNLPQVPVNTVSRLIAGKAWGAFKEGAIYLYEKAELGTGYHEAFEAVWNSMLTPAQQKSLTDEFKARTGQFTNPFSRETKDYADASAYDVKEMLSEEFRTFVLTDGQKAPATPEAKGFFQKLWSFIKKLFNLSADQTKELNSYVNKIFSEIHSGKFANVPKIKERAAVSPEFRAVGPFNQKDTQDLIEGLTYYFFSSIYEKNNNIDSLLGDLTKQESSALFNELFDAGFERVINNARVKNINNETMLRLVKDEFKAEFKKHISRFGLEFDEDSFAKEDTAVDTLGIKDSMTIDPRKAAKINVKLLIASLPVYDIQNGKAKVHKNGMLQPKLVDYDRTLTLLLNELGNTVVKYDQKGQQVSVLDQMMDKLDELYKQPDGQYRNGYTWINQLKNRLKYNQDNLTEDDIRMQVGFIATFTNVRVSPEKLIFGEAGANYSFNPLMDKNTDRIKDTWSNNIKDTLTGAKTIWQVGASGMIEIDRTADKYADIKKVLNASSSMTLPKALDMLGLFGIQLSYPIESLETYKTNIVEDTKAILRQVVDGKVNNIYDLYSGDIVGGRINSLLELEAAFSGEENILSYNNASGMPKYAVSIPSLFSNTINTLNSVNSLTELVQSMPWLGTVDRDGTPMLYTYQSDSNILKPDGILFDKNGRKRPGVKVTFHDISGVGMNEADGVDTADLQFPDRVANKVHYALRNITFSNINSDKGTEFGIGFSKGKNYLPNLVDAKDVTNFLYQGGSDKIMNLYTAQLMSELQTVVEHHNNPNFIEVYQKDIYKLGHFGDVLAPSGLLTKYQKLFKKDKKAPANTATKFMRENEAAIKEAITKYLNQRVEETSKFLLDLDLFTRIPDTTDYISEAISNEGQYSLRSILNIRGQEITRGDESRFYFTSTDINNLAGFLAFNEELMIAEQHKLIYGHPAMYKDLPKRANGPTATKEEMVQDDHIIKWMDDNMQRADGKERSLDDKQTMRVITFKDQSVISQHYQDIAEGLYEMLKTTETEAEAQRKIGAKFSKDGKLQKFLYDADGKHTGFIKAYVDLNEADAMAWGMPDMVRDILFLSGKLSKEQKNQWEYELAYEKLVRAGLMERADGTTMKGGPGFKALTNADEIKALREIVKKGDPGHVFQVLKTQYFGYEKNYELAGKESAGLLTHPVFLKHSVQPKFFRHVEGSQFEMLYIAAQNKQVDVIGFESGEKVGNVTAPDGSVAPLYKENGTVNVTGIELPVELPIQNLYSRFFGIQVATADYAKNVVVRGTQVTKIVMVNFMENGVAGNPELSNLITEYNATLERMIRLGKESLLKELGLELDTTNIENKYKVKDLSKLVDLLRKEAISRDLPDNVIDAINAVTYQTGESELLYRFDTLINATKIDNILNSIVDSRVISEKMSGKAAIQVASTLYESNPRTFMVLRNGVYVNLEEALKIKELTEDEKKTVKMTSSDLKSYYRKDGSISKMEVYINWPFEGVNPESLGLKLENGIYRIPEGGVKGLDNRLLEAIGFRIPTQSMNSIESVVIKGFVPKTAGDMVVVPSDLVGKAGSDFDIDKLNMYLPNFTVKNVKIGTEEFYNFMREELSKLYSAEQVEDMLTMGDDVFKRINQATFTDYGKEQKQADFSLEDLARETGGTFEGTFEILSNIKEAIQKFNLNTKGTYVDYIEEDDTTKRGLQNKFIRLMGEMITAKENFRQLVTPNNVDNLKSLATEINGLKVAAGTVVKDNEKSKAYLRSFMGNSRIRERYLTAKRMVGISAIHTTFHAMAQVAGIKLSSSYDITLGGKYLTTGPEDIYRDNEVKLREHPRDADNNVLVGWKTDVDGVAISDRFSEGTSGFVDGAKDPFVFDLNFSMDTAGTWFYLAHRGVPEKDIAYFMNQPVLDEYFARQAKNKSLFKKANGRNKYNEELYLDVIGPYYKKVTGKDIKAILASVEDFALYQKKKQIIAEIEDIANRVESFDVADMKKQIEKGKNADATYQIAILNNYLKYAVQARQLGGYIQAISYDNKKTKTLYENQMQVANWERSKQVGFIANPEAILDSTFIGELKNQKEDLSDLFKDFFITLEKEVRNLFTPLEEFIADPEHLSSKADTINLLNRYQNFVVAYLLHTSDFVKDGSVVKLNHFYEELLMGTDSLANQLMKYKLSADPRIANNLVIKELLPILTDDVNKGNNIRLLRSRMDVIKINRVIEEVNNLRSFAIQTADTNLLNFVDNLAIFSILQSGVQASSIDFKKVLPVEVYSELVKKIINSARTRKDLDPQDVWRKFHQNNFTNRSIVPKVPSYIKVANNEFKISGTSSMARYQFMVKYVPKMGYTLKEAMKKGAEAFKPRMFERVAMDSKGKWIYKPLNVMGDGRRFLEIYNDDRASIINENNVQGRLVSGAKVSADGYVSLTPEEIAIITGSSPTGLRIAEKNVPEKTPVKSTDLSDKVVEGDIFSIPGIPVITTNLGGVHGAGLAQLAKNKRLIQQGDGAYKASDKVVQLPVKKVWSDSMSMNNNMGLLQDSLDKLKATAAENPGKTYLLPLAGLGHGEGSVSDILPLLIDVVKNTANVKLVLPADNVNLGRQGTVRKDSTREKMPEIKQMLAANGLVSGASNTVDKSTLKDGDVVYDKNGTKFIFRGLRAEGQTGAGSPRLEEADGNIVIPGENIQLYNKAPESEAGFSKNALTLNLLRQALGKPSVDSETLKKLNDKENESKNCNS